MIKIEDIIQYITSVIVTGGFTGGILYLIFKSKVIDVLRTEDAENEIRKQIEGYILPMIDEKEKIQAEKCSKHEIMNEKITKRFEEHRQYVENKLETTMLRIFDKIESQTQFIMSLISNKT